MNYPQVDVPHLVKLLEPLNGPCNVVIDTDTYNEIDDQFAIVHALLSDEFNIEAMYAAPFHNEKRATEGPGHGMELSYQEIIKLLDFMKFDAKFPVLRGSNSYMSEPGVAIESPMVDDLIDRAMSDREGPLYVLALGTPTNVSSAILKEPRITSRIVVVPLGGRPYDFSTYDDFNFRQDINSLRVLFDCGAAVIHMPALMVSEMMRTTEAELARYVKGKGPIGDYLYELYCEWVDITPGSSKPIWDLAPGGYLMNPAWAESRLTPSPIINDGMLYSFDSSRHPVRLVTRVDRDAIFADFFEKLAGSS